jgi:hypothetical protein
VVLTHFQLELEVQPLIIAVSYSLYLCMLSQSLRNGLYVVCNAGYGGGRTSACNQCSVGKYRNSTQVSAGTTGKGPSPNQSTEAFCTAVPLRSLV